MHTIARLPILFALVALAAWFGPATPAAQALAEREIGFHLGPYNPAYPLVIDPTLQWNTFLGSSGSDYGNGVAVDASGNVYVVGYSYATWGSPIRPFTAGDYDAFVAKLSSTGSLVWNTFLGAWGGDEPRDIALDSSGNIYVIGYSYNTWGDAPRRPFSGSGGVGDAFVAKLDSSGALLWNTFLGGNSSDDGTAITVDASGNIYAAGSSYAVWGTVNPESYTASVDGFVAKLTSDGTLLWNSFLGGSAGDYAKAIAADANGNVYVIGDSGASWGSPVRGFSTGSSDAYVAKLNSGGFLQWNTFLGSTKSDLGRAIALDASGSIYVLGISYATWGDLPRRPYSASMDIFVAGLDSIGALQWNTFLGGAVVDNGTGISVDGSGHLYVIGHSSATWGSPIWPFLGGIDAAMSKLDSSGNLLWNTFFGSLGDDYGNGISIDASGKVYVTGRSDRTWGSPLEPPHGAQDAFVAVIGNEQSFYIYLPLLLR